MIPRSCKRQAGPLLQAAALLSIGLGSAHAEDAPPLRIMSAGSLRSALTELIATFDPTHEKIGTPLYGPSGLLRKEIEAGQAVDLFTSADMSQPRVLAQSHKVPGAVPFARNRICLVARREAAMTQANMLDRLLDPAVRLATSTPGADPSGDYAWAIFARAEQVRPGAQATLQAKALQLVGGQDSKPLLPGHSAGAGIFLTDRADAIPVYCSGTAALIQEVPGLVAIELPRELAVHPVEGLIALSDNPVATKFALFILSETGQAIMARHGFQPIGQTSE